MATGRRDARLRDGAMAARRDPIRELRILNQECIVRKGLYPIYSTLAETPIDLLRTIAAQMGVH
jgi:hypothetical protein